MAFVADSTKALGQYGLALIELVNGGYGLIEAKVLEAAPAVTAKKWLQADEMKALHAGNIKVSDFEIELMDGIDLLGDDG
jgi:hypothetical protein